MDPGVAQHYRLDLKALNDLDRRILDDYQPEAWGLRRYAGINDVTDRAVASDLLVSLCAGVKTALLDLAMASARYEEILGPNGRTMPGPTTTIEERVALAQLEAASTECFRALGSALDCLAALCVLLVGMPLSVQRAEGGWLLRRPKGRTAPATQEAAWASIVEAVAEEADTPEPGWLAWALETRNAVVHRGQLLRLWLNRPGGRQLGDPQLVVKTDMPARYLVRMEQHLRRRPWLPDMHALIKGVDLRDLWIAEPAQTTLDHLTRRSAALAACVATMLIEIWDAGMETFEWPAEAWQLETRDQGGRIDLAEQFAGFEPGYPVPLPSELRAHTDSAKRPALAQRLRTEL